MPVLRWTQEQFDAHRSRMSRQIADMAALAKVEAPPKKQKKRSALEVELERQMAMCGLNPIAEFKPLSGRRFRLDFAWPEQKFAVEVDGAVHRIKARFHSDLEKGALVLIDGWRVLHVGREQIMDGRAIEWIRRLVR